MKYQQLENLECGWKWHYLVKKYHEGESITRHTDPALIQQAVDLLFKIENQPICIKAWLSKHLHPDLEKRLGQTIRARRKRHFNAEHKLTRKKSVDLEFAVWEQFSALARKRKSTLSDTLVELIQQANLKEKYTQKLRALQDDLLALLTQNKTIH